MAATDSWNALPLAASLIGVGFASLAAGLLIGKLFDVRAHSIREPHRRILAPFVPSRVPTWYPAPLGLLVGSVFLALIGLVGLLIPLQFVANPSSVRVYGTNGQASGLVSLLLFAVWVS